MAAVARAVAGAAISVSLTGTSAQAPTPAGAPGLMLKTPWGEPDLQGIWTDETDTPLQRSPRYANQEFFTAEQRAELDKQRSALIRRDRRAQPGTEGHRPRAYNAGVPPPKRPGARTTRIGEPAKLPHPRPTAQPPT